MRTKPNQCSLYFLLCYTAALCFSTQRDAAILFFFKQLSFFFFKQLCLGFAHCRLLQLCCRPTVFNCDLANADHVALSTRRRSAQLPRHLHTVCCRCQPQPRDAVTQPYPSWPCLCWPYTCCSRLALLIYSTERCQLARALFAPRLCLAPLLQALSSLDAVVTAASLPSIVSLRTCPGCSWTQTSSSFWRALVFIWETSFFFITSDLFNWLWLCTSWNPYLRFGTFIDGLDIDKSSKLGCWISLLILQDKNTPWHCTPPDIYNLSPWLDNFDTNRTIEKYWAFTGCLMWIYSSSSSWILE